MYGAIIRMYVASVLLSYLPVAVQVVEWHRGVYWNVAGSSCASAMSYCKAHIDCSLP
jgi:hypothetical protein